LKYLLLILFVSIEVSTSAQPKFYFNGAIGAMNYGGDLQEKKFTFQQSNPSLTLGATYYFQPNLLGNVNLTYGKIGSNDSRNGPKWFYRNLDFKSNIYEAAVTVEYDLYDIRESATPEFKNTDQETIRYTPYIFAGIGVFNFNPYTHYNGEKVFLAPLRTEAQAVPYSLWSVSIPFGFGVKYALSENVFIGAELNIRKTLTDYIDDVSTFHFVDTTTLLSTSGQLAASLSFRADEIPDNKYPFYSQRGNPKKKDVFYNFAVKVIFKIGEGTSLFKYGYGN
jgi:opacity protein-like surface antigen